MFSLSTHPSSSLSPLFAAASFPFIKSSLNLRSRASTLAVLALSAAAAIPANAQSGVRQLGVQRAATSAGKQTHVSYADSPLNFEENQGQLSSQARYMGKGPGYSVLLEEQRVVLEVQGSAKPSAPNRAAADPVKMMGLSPLPAPSRIELSLLGADAQAKMGPSLQQLGYSNYYPTTNPASWHSHVPTYGRVDYSEIYPGIDLAFYGKGHSLEYDFRLKAGVDASRIELGIGGADEARLDESGRLLLQVADAHLEFLKPEGYQIGADGARETIPVNYRLAQTSEGKDKSRWLLSFAVGPHDTSRDVIIDPVLSYGSYFPTLESNIGGIASDGSGNTYVTGAEQGRGFYVNKYDPNGTLLVHTVVGAGVTTSPSGIAIDSSGNAYVSGTAYMGLPATSNAYQNYTGTHYVAFVAVMPSGGGAPTYLSYLGGTGYDFGAAIALDSSNKIYIAGYESSTNFPTTAGAYLTTYPGGSYSAFAAKFDPTKSGAASLVYSTLVDAAAITSYAQGIAVDSTGAAYLAVQSNQGYPVTSGAYSYTGGYPDTYTPGAYVTKLNATGTGLTYSAYLGPGTAAAVAIDTNGDAYATGAVQAEDFPVTSGAYQTTYPGGFAAELNPAGTALIYSTFLSGPSGAFNPASVSVFPQSIALTPGCASACAAYIGGMTSATDFPAVNPLQSAVGVGSYGPYVFLVALAGNGASANYSTYLTGLTSTVNDNPYGTPIGVTPSVAVDTAGDVYMAANVSGYDFPATLPVPTSAGGYVAKVSAAAGGYVIANPLSLNFDSYIYTGEAVGVSSTLSGIPVPLILQNFGSSPVTISSLTFTPSTEFSETDSCGGSIPAGGICTLNLALTPTASGKRTATLAVNSNAVVSPVNIALSGTAYADGYLQISAPELTFPDQATGSTSAVQMLTITNIGETLVNLQPIALAGVSAAKGNGSDFQALDTCPAQLQPAASCSVGVTFTPLATGLRAAYFSLQGDGFGNQNVYLYGEGIAGSADGTVALSATTLNFNTQLLNTIGPRQAIIFTNTSSFPASLFSVSIATTGQTGHSDFSIYNGSCANAAAIQLLPQASCTLNIQFSPTAAVSETGTVTFVDSAAGSPHKVSLTGVGVAATQTLEFTPGSSVFPDQPVGVPSTGQYFYVYNTSTAPVTVDRVLLTGDFSLLSTSCAGAILKPSPSPGYYPTPGCNVRVVFTPTTTGTRTGTLSLVDAASGTPQVLNLTGTGIAATGAIFLEPAALTYPSQAVGTSSVTQRFSIDNPGNSPTTINNVTTTGDYAIVDVCASPFPFVLAAGRTCAVDVSFTPTSTTNPRSGSAVVSSSAGSATLALTGTGVTATAAVGLTPTALDFGDVQTTTSVTMNVFFRNAGTDVLTLTSGTATGDYAFGGGNCGFYGNALNPGASCYVQVTLTPTATGTRTGTMSLVDTAGTQTVNLTGVGVAAYSGLVPTPNQVAFDQVPVGSTSASGVYVYLHNYGTSSVMIKTAAISSGGNAFVIPASTGNCNGATIAASSYCYAVVSFSPTTSGYLTGVLTFTDSTNATHNVSLAGYAPPVTVSAYIDPPSIEFPGQVLTTDSANQIISLYNTSDVPLTVGTLSGTNTIVGSTTTGAFSTNGTQGGSDGCSGATVAARSKCSVYVAFAPASAATVTGTLVFPVTYGNAATAQFTANLKGTGVAVKNDAQVSPTAINFEDQAVGAVYSAGADPAQTITLYNKGNLPFNVGALTGVDTVIGSTTTGDFSTSSTFGGYDGCTGQSVAVGSSCQVTVGFNPSSVASKSGKITFPITYSDATTTSLSTTLAGKGVTPNSKVLVSPSSGQFDVQVVGTTSDSSETLTFTLTNTGNLPVKIATSTITSNFSFVNDYCSGTTVAINSYCQIVVAFSPTATGVVTGTLTIPDNAAGNPHKVSLSGTGIATNQQIVLSQTTINFPNQVVTTKSGSIYVTVSNQSGSTVPVSSAVLSGTNASDFIMSDGCSGQSISPHSYCTLGVQFAPASGSLGARTAKITETDAASGSPRTIILNGTGIASGPNVALYPASLNFGNQVLNTVSPPMTFSVTNTGTTTLNIAHVTSSNTSEFAVKTDACTGAAVAPGANCLVTVTFAPNAGSTQSATIQITSNAPSSPNSLPVSGVSVGVPAAALNPTSLTFASQGVGVASAAQSITLSNSGTDKLVIAGIAIGGTNPGDFAQTNNCGTSIAAGTNCSISVTFTPTATGARSASVTVTDNAGNTTGSTQSATLSGTGSGVQEIGFSPTSLTFGSQNVGTSSATKTVTVSNPGSAPLTISGIAISPTGDFTDTTTCGSSLAAGGTCAVTVTFSPSAAGTRTASIDFTDGASGSPQTVGLSGTGSAPQVSFSPGSFTFASDNVGTNEGPQSIVVSNTGNKTLSVTSIALTGTNASDFVEFDTCQPSVAAGATCEIALYFRPSAPGARTANVVLTDNAENVTGATQTVPVTGTGTGAPMATTSVSGLTFAAQAVGTQSNGQSFSLANTGNATLNVASIAVTGTNASDYSAFQSCTPTVTAGSDCTVVVFFTPTAAGTRTAAITITDNSNNTSGAVQTVNLSGTGGSVTFTVSPSSLTFASTAVGSTTAAQTVTVSNAGSSAVTFSGTSFTGTNASSFVKSSTTCGSSLAAGTSCTISVEFAPTAAGSLTASLSVADNATGSPQMVALSGTGTSAAITVSVSPSSLTFASTAVGSTTAAQTVTVSNTGSSSATLSGTSFTGTNASSFLQSSTTCGSSLAGGASCTISVEFTPATAGSLTASLSVADNATGSPQTVSLSGTGTSSGTPPLTFNPTSEVWGSVAVGSSSGAHVLTVENTSASTVTFDAAGVTFTGADPTSFVKSATTCGSTLAAGASCTVSLIFKPTTTGSLTATMNYGASGAEQTVSLSGTGAAGSAGGPGAPPLTFNPSSEVWGSVAVGSTSGAHTITVENTSSATVTLDAAGVTFTGTDASSFLKSSTTCGSTLAAGASCTVSLVFKPATTGSLTATMNYGASGAEQTVSLSGTGR